MNIINIILQTALSLSAALVYDKAIIYTHNFEATNSLTLGSREQRNFKLNFLDNEQYCLYEIRTKGDCDTYLELYADGKLIKSNDNDGGSKNSVIYFKRDEGVSYSYIVKNNDLDKKTFTIKFLPEYPMYFNSVNLPDDPNGGNAINTVNDIEDIIDDLNSTGYYVYNCINASFSDMNTEGTNGRNKFNNKYYFISSHGGEYGRITFNLNSKVYASSFPIMDKCEVAIFAICYGGKEGNAADYVVKNKSVKNSIGWPGLTYTDTSKTFTDTLFYCFKYGDNIYEAANEALNKINSVYWYKNLFNTWGDDTIKNFKIYGLNESALQSNLKALNIDVNYKYKFEIDENFLKLMTDYSFNNQDYKILCINNVGTNFVAKKIGGKYYANFQDFDLNFISEHETTNQILYIFDGEEYHNIEILKKNNQNIFYDFVENKILNFESLKRLIEL